jgi:hypothetical protein
MDDMLDTLWPVWPLGEEDMPTETATRRAHSILLSDKAWEALCEAAKAYDVIQDDITEAMLVLKDNPLVFRLRAVFHEIYGSPTPAPTL